MQKLSIRSVLERNDPHPSSALEVLTRRLADNGIVLNIETGPWLAGGSVRRSIAEGSWDLHKDTDFDLFFANHEQFNTVFELLALKSGINVTRDDLYYRDEYDESVPANPEIKTDIIMSSAPWSKHATHSINRLTFNGDNKWKCNLDVSFLIGTQTNDVANFKMKYTPFDSNAQIAEYDIQLIEKRFFADAEELINYFDFTICQFVTDGTTLLCGDFSLWDLGRKKLVVNKITYPVSSMRRMIKYANQGFYVCNGSMVQFLQQVVEDPQILETAFDYVD